MTWKNLLARIGSRLHGNAIAGLLTGIACLDLSNAVYALDPVDIAPLYYEFHSASGLTNGSEWSGLAHNNGLLYAIDGGSTQTLKEMTTAGAEIDRVNITGITDVEGITHVAGNQFALIDEATGRIYLFDMPTALATGTYNIATNNQGVITTGLVEGNIGLEGIAYSAAGNFFYVAKENETNTNNRGIYSVNNNPQNPGTTFLFDPFATANNISDLHLAGGYLYITSDSADIIFRRNMATGITDPQSLFITGLSGSNYEGIAIDPVGDIIYLVGDDVGNDEFVTYELPTGYDFDSNGFFTAADIDLIQHAVGGGNLAFDLDGDMDVDVNDVDFYVKDFLYTFYGDANLDREFNSADLVAVFVAGEYEDSIENNSGWAEGDWTPASGIQSDFDYTSGDLVTAFADGGYETGPRL